LISVNHKKGEAKKEEPKKEEDSSSK